MVLGRFVFYYCLEFSTHVNIKVTKNIQWREKKNEIKKKNSILGFSKKSWTDRKAIPLYSLEAEANQLTRILTRFQYICTLSKRRRFCKDIFFYRLDLMFDYHVCFVCGRFYFVDIWYIVAYFFILFVFVLFSKFI